LLHLATLGVEIVECKLLIAARLVVQRIEHDFGNPSSLRFLQRWLHSPSELRKILEYFRLGAAGRDCGGLHHEIEGRENEIVRIYAVEEVALLLSRIAERVLEEFELNERAKEEQVSLLTRKID